MLAKDAKRSGESKRTREGDADGAGDAPSPRTYCSKRRKSAVSSLWATVDIE
jgi:hypothetical protein